VGKPQLRNSGARGIRYKAARLSEELIRSLSGMRTQAFRIRWSSRDWYASYRMLEDSSTLPPCSAAYLTNLFDVTGTSVSGEAFDTYIAGSRNGSDPVGEEWLFEETSRWSTPAMLRKVYHC